MNMLIKLLVVIILMIGGWTPAKSQDLPVSDWTIDIYYKSLSAKHLPILDKFKERASLVKEVDYVNKYLLLANDEWKGWGEVVLFNKKGGGYLLAVTQYDCSRQYHGILYSRYATCAGQINLLEYDGKIWVVKNNLLPDMNKLMLYRHFEKKTGRLANGDDKLIFELPRERKDILVKLSGESVYSLIWDGEKFVGEYVE